MDDNNGVKNNQIKSFLPEQVRKRFHYWFVKYNPLYFFSALCVLFGVFLISKGLSELDWGRGQLFLTVVMQVYEIILIVGGAVLFRIAGQYRPAVILGLLEVFFIFDCTFRTEMMTTVGRAGVITSVAWVVLMALKLYALVWIFRLKASALAIIVPILAAVGVAGTPHALEQYHADKVLIHLGALWYGALLMVSVLYVRPKIYCAIELDDWGKTVLNRAKRTALMMWAGFYLLHLITWMAMFPIPFTLAQAAPFFLLWFLAKKEFWVWAGGLVVIALTIVVPSVVSPIAAIVAIAFGLKARQLRRYRFYVGAVLSLYFAVWTIGWQGRALPEPNLWLNAITTLIFVVMVWRLRLPLAIPAAIAVILPGVEAIIPHGTLTLGILLMVTGFIALIAGVIVNLNLKKMEPEHVVKQLTREQAEMLARLKSGKKQKEISARDAPIVGLWHYIMGETFSFHHYPNISERKLRNAMISYASLQPEEQVIALQDSTVFGSARVGCLITTRGIHYRSFDTNRTGYVGFEKIDPDSVNGEKGKDMEIIYLRQDLKIEFNGIKDEDDLSKFLEFIKKAATTHSADA